MYCAQNRIYCGVCHKAVLPDNYPNHLRSQGHVNNRMKNQCTNSMIKKHIIRKDKRKQNLILI